MCAVVLRCSGDGARRSAPAHHAPEFASRPPMPRRRAAARIPGVIDLRAALTTPSESISRCAPASRIVVHDVARAVSRAVRRCRAQRDGERGEAPFLQVLLSRPVVSLPPCERLPVHQHTMSRRQLGAVRPSRLPFIRAGSGLIWSRFGFRQCRTAAKASAVKKSAAGLIPPI